VCFKRKIYAAAAFTATHIAKRFKNGAASVMSSATDCINNENDQKMISCKKMMYFINLGRERTIIGSYS
jgi:hypothetical protein